MPAADQNDLGSIAIAAVIATIIFGSLLYILDSANDVQTASDLGPIEKTVPTIVPATPQILGIPWTA
jgi:hypothetical protein